MSYFYDLNIGEIRIVAKKEEKTDFHYSCKSRRGDGFVFFFQGNGTIAWENDENACQISEGSLVLLKKGDSYRIDTPSPCAYIVADYDLVSSSFPSIKHHKCTVEEIDLIDTIVEVYSKRDATCFIQLRALLLNLYSIILKKTSVFPYASSHTTLALSYLHRNYDKNFSLYDIADFCKVSESHLRAIFRKETGKSVFAYREGLRIKKAKQMLKSNAFAIKEIADSLGYFDVYHFSKKFKAATGLSPHAYRNSRK